MNREVEERIVAMYFDNQDFEKNAKTTIDTLGQLKNSLDLGKEAEKGFSVFEKLGKTLNFDKANQGLQKMRNTLGGMKNIFSKVFNLGPLDNAYRALDNFKSRYFDRVLGFDIAGKLASSLENAFRSLTIGPISAGWSQYESKMDSVKTIMSSTGESMEVVEKHLQDMTNYANQTIYSLTDMTSNLGKFTNNGVKLEDAVKAMEGIANATADAGQGSAQASMAMYNISQAMGVGKMTTIDWKSLENANIATVKLKDTFLEMAAAQGKLRKETKKVGNEIKTSYWLETDEEGKKLKKAVELNASNFREYLSKGWLDKETMLRTFMLYSGEGVDQNTLKSWGIKDEEEQKRLLKIGEEARAAATEVRTFTKMMDALKESVQSGWADSFQIIFGNMEDGTQLWSRMNEKFDSILTRITNRRNKALKEWAETDEEGRSIWTRDENNNTVRREGVKGGRDILLDSLFELIDVVQTLGEAISKTFSSVFGEVDGKRLLDLTLKFRDLVEGIKEWFGSMDDKKSRISKLMKGLTGVLNIVKILMRALKTAATWLMGKLSPVVDWVIDKFSWLGTYFANYVGDMDLSKIPAHLGKVIASLWKRIKAVFTSKDGKSDSPFVSWIKNVWDGFKDTIRTFANNLGLGGVIDAVSNAWHTVTGWEGWKTIGDFFSNVWGWIESTFGVVINWFTPGEDGSDSGFVQFLNNVASEISRIWGIIAGWEGWKEIGNFFTDIWNWITGTAKDAIAWFQPGEDGSDSGFIQFLNNIASEISRIWGIVSGWSGWEDIKNFFTDIWNWITGTAKDAIAWFQPGEDGSKSGFIQFIESVASGISGIWATVSKWEGWGRIKLFFTDIWNWITGTAKSAIEWFRPSEDGSDSGFVTFLKNTKKAIVDAWDQLHGWDGWKQIGKFFGDVWGWVLGFVSGGNSGDENKGSGSSALSEIKSVAEDTEQTVGPVQKAVGFFERVIGAIGEFFEKVKGVVAEFTGTSGITEFLTAAGDFFKGVFHQFSIILQSFGDIFNGKGDFTDWTNIIGIVLPIIIVKIADLFNNKYLSKIDNGQNFAQKFMEIAGGLLMMAGAVALLTTIDSGKMWSAVGAIAVLGTIVGVITGIIAKMKANEFHDAEVTSTERIVNNLISTIGKVGMVFVVLKMLPSIIETVGKVKQQLGGASIGEDMLNIMLSISALIASTSLIFAIVQKITGQGLDITATAKTVGAILVGIGLLIAGFTAAGGLLSLFGDKAPQDVAKMIDGFAMVLSSIGGAIGGFFSALFGGGTSTQKANETARTLETLAESSKIFDNEKVSGITRMMSLIKMLTEQSESIDPKKLDGFAEAMGKLGAGIYEYVRFIKGDDYMQAFADLSDPSSDIYKRLLAFNQLGINLGELLAPFGSDGFHVDMALERISALAEEGNLEKLVADLNKIMSGLTNLNDPDSGINFDGLAIVQKLYSAIQEGLIDPKLPKFDATPIVDGILEALGLGNSAIALAVHNMVQEGLNLSGSDEENGGGLFSLDGAVQGIKDLFGDTENAGKLFNMDALKEQFYGKDGKGGILGEINGLGDKIPSMASMFEGKGWMDFKDEDGKDIDLLGEIQNHLSTLGTTLSTMDPLTVKITPVFDWTNLTPEAIQAELDNRPLTVLGGTETKQLSIDFTGLDTALDMQALRTGLDNIRSAVIVYGNNTATAVSNLAGHMDGIANEVARLKLYLDTGALVGGITPYIDKELNKRSLTSERTGVP